MKENRIAHLTSPYYLSSSAKGSGAEEGDFASGARSVNVHELQRIAPSHIERPQGACVIKAERRERRTSLNTQFIKLRGSESQALNLHTSA